MFVSLYLANHKSDYFWPLNSFVMEKPKIAQKKPFVMAMQPGLYSWCTCGKSEKQPFCDGKHREDMEYRSMKIEITEPKTVAWCGCKYSNNKPFCDGSHSKL